MLGLVKQTSKIFLKKTDKKSKSNPLVQQPSQATAESTVESSAKLSAGSPPKPVSKSAPESNSVDPVKLLRQDISDITSVEDKSRRAEKSKRRKREKVAVVNANGDEGASIVRTLAKKSKKCCNTCLAFASHF